MIVLPSCPFPSLAWCQIAYNSDASLGEVVVDIHENFVKQTVRNRILLSNAQGEMSISLPVHRRNALSKSLADILFTDAMSPTVLIRHLRTGYGAAPFFEHYEESLIEFLEKNGKPGMSLIDFNMGSLKWIENELDLSSVNSSSKYIKHIEVGHPSQDLRVKGRFSSNCWSYKKYPQVFEDRNVFVSGCSVLDGMFHGGPEVKNWWDRKVTRLSSRHE